MADCRHEASEIRRRRRVRRLALRIIRIGAAICALLLALSFGLLYANAAEQLNHSGRAAFVVQYK